jgi:tetratricopeptide (TPR) repeat protein
MYFGPTTADETLAWCEELSWLESARPGISVFRARALGLLGRLDESRTALEKAEDTIRELGLPSRSGAAFARGELALLVADFAGAERHLAAGLDEQEQQGAFGVVSTYAAQLARALVGLGRYDDAEASIERSRELGAGDDIATQVLWRQALAGVLVQRGDHDAALKLAREAIARAEATDMLLVRGDAWSDLASILELAGDTDGGAAALERALAEYEQKGVVPAIARIRARLVAIRAPA